VFSQFSELTWLNIGVGYGLALCLAATWRRFPAQAWLLRWALGALLVAVAGTLLSLRTAVPDFLTIVLANPLLILGVGTYYVAARETFSLGSDFPWHWVAAAIAATGVVYFAYVVPDMETRILIISGLHVPILIATGVMFLRATENGITKIEYLCAGMFIVGGILHWLRVALTNAAFVTADPHVMNYWIGVLPSLYRVALDPIVAAGLFVIARSRSEDAAAR
jgi:hypothetical protein